MPWLRIHRHGENRGVNAACNSGLGLVGGDFVLFSAADDRLDDETVERAFAAASAFPTSGIVFSDQAEMSADGAAKRLMPLDLPPQRRHFSADEFVRLMQRNFFYFHVSSVWFNVKLLRARRLSARAALARRLVCGLRRRLRAGGNLRAGRRVVFSQRAGVV
jgi:glycosyltransferase involved in cell wall biosynthesis